MKTQEDSGAAAETKAEDVIRHERIYRFKRDFRLKGRNDIQAVFKQGKNFSCSGAKLLVKKNNLTYNRICFTFTRGFGNAVKRNHSRRLSREAFRLLQVRLHGGHDFVFLVFPGNQVSLATRTRQLEILFSKAGLLK